MKTYAIINQKGGVGKSTTAHAIGAGLARAGHAVLYVDLDAQGNLSFSMGADAKAAQNALSVLLEPSTMKDAIQAAPGGAILPSSPFLATADAALTETGKEYRLKEALEAVQGEYAFCIVDTPPALGVLTINALTACSSCIIPAQADVFSLQGVLQLAGTIGSVRRYCNPGLEVDGLLLTRYNPRAVLARDMAALAQKTAEQMGSRVYQAAIRECTALKEAQAMKQDIFTYSPRSNAATDYAALVDEILNPNR